MRIEKLQPGMVVHDVGRHKMGNTTISTVAVWDVFIESVDVERMVVVASWNGNAPKEYREHQWAKWRVKKPTLIRGAMGNYRIARRDEVAST